jgi:hypothetical protein
MKIVRPLLRRLHSPDIIDLDTFHPEDENSFGFLLQAMFGPENAVGEESFDLTVCTPKWLDRQAAEEFPLFGRHYLFVKSYDIGEIRSVLAKYAEQCGGDSWAEVARQLARIGKWEFEDYRP